MIQSNLAENCNFLPELTSIYYTASPHGPTFVLPEITCVSEIFDSRTEFPFSRRDRFCYRVYSINLETPATFIFSDQARAEQSRTDLIDKLVEFWGPDDVVFSNGPDSWLAIVCAIQDISPVESVKGAFAFSVQVVNVERPIAIESQSLEKAIAVNEQLMFKLELVRIDKVRP